MFINSIKELFLNDINKLRTEIASYPSEELIWKTLPNIPNSGGTLCLHICGNLQHFIGNLIGKSGYQRNREAEFSGNALPISALFDELKLAEEAVELGLNKLKESQLDENFPALLFDKQFSHRKLLMLFYGHLNYHLGQVNYHRRTINEI